MSLKQNFAFFSISTPLFLVLFLLLSVQRAHAATYTWDGGGATNNWSECANWTTDTCLTATDDAVFDGTSTKASMFDIAAIRNLTISAAYTGTITQNQDVVMSGNIVQDGGTYNGGSNYLEIVTITLTGGAFNAPDDMMTLGLFTSMSLSGGVFTAPANVLSVRRAMTIVGPGNYVHNNGTLALVHPGNNSRHNIYCGNAVFNLVTIIGSKRIKSDCDLPLGNNPTAIEPLLVSWPHIYLEGGTIRGTGQLSIGVADTSQGIQVTDSGSILGFTTLETGRLIIDATTLDLSPISSVNVRVRIQNNNGSILTAPSQLTIGSALTSGYTIEFTNGSTSTFNHNNGTVTLTGVTNVVNGDSTFNNLHLIDALDGTTLTFEAGSTQTIDGNLSLSGSSGADLLSLSSNTPGSPWNIVVNGTHNLRYLSMADSNNAGPLVLSAYDSQDTSNNSNFAFGPYPVTPPPAESVSSPSESVSEVVSDTLAETGNDHHYIESGLLLIIIVLTVYSLSNKHVHYRLLRQS